MNHIKLVEMIKSVTREKFLNEASHGARYQNGNDLSSTKLQNRYKKNYKTQLAEVDSEQQPDTGTTMTKQPANKINTKPDLQSQMAPVIQGTKSTKV